jgi:hypothetical protein
MKERTIFLSYAQKDSLDIRKVLSELRSKGFIEDNDQILDTSKVMVPGSSIRGLLREAVKASSKVIVLWSREGAESEFVNYEIAMAEALGKPIVVVVPKGQKSKMPGQLTENVVLEIEGV